MGIQNHLTRRSVIASGISFVGIATAGCLGDDDDTVTDPTGGSTPTQTPGETESPPPDDANKDGDGDGDEDENETDDDPYTIDRPEDWPDNPAFTPNPDVSGPGGDAWLAMYFRIRDFSDASAFETFAVDFEEITFHTADNETVTVPVQRTIDFYAFELEQPVILVFDADIPAGTYTAADYHMQAVKIEHSEDGDVTDSFVDPPQAETFDQALDVEAGEQYLFDSMFHVGYSSSEVTLSESTSIGSFSTPADMSDPSFFADF